jgi:hypothetical protein
VERQFRGKRTAINQNHRPSEADEQWSRTARIVKGKGAHFAVATYYHRRDAYGQNGR